MGSYAIGVLVLVAVLLAWVGVQVAWRKAFPGLSPEPDVLAGRMGCHGCAGDPDLHGDAEEQGHGRE